MKDRIMEMIRSILAKYYNPLNERKIEQNYKKLFEEIAKEFEKEEKNVKKRKK